MRLARNSRRVRSQGRCRYTTGWSRSRRLRAPRNSAFCEDDPRHRVGGVGELIARADVSGREMRGSSFGAVVDWTHAFGRTRRRRPRVPSPSTIRRAADARRGRVGAFAGPSSSSAKRLSPFRAELESRAGESVTPSASSAGGRLRPRRGPLAAGSRVRRRVRYLAAEPRERLGQFAADRTGADDGQPARQSVRVKTVSLVKVAGLGASLDRRLGSAPPGRDHGPVKRRRLPSTSILSVGEAGMPIYTSTPSLRNRSPNHVR